jgi:hypothetical protein
LVRESRWRLSEVLDSLALKNPAKPRIRETMLRRHQEHLRMLFMRLLHEWFGREQSNEDAKPSGTLAAKPNGFVFHFIAVS